MSTLNSVTLRQARIAQISLVAVALPIALLYVLLPLLAGEIGSGMGVEHLVVPYSIAACLAVAALHIFILSVWKIVGFIKTGDFYIKPVECWVRIAKGAALFSCAMPILVLVHLVLFENSGGPLALPAAFGIVMLAVAGAALLDLLVGLYREASSNVTELSEVI